MTDWRLRSRRTAEMEEGSPPGATGYQGDYSARLADLVMEFASMDMSDQEFLRSLLPTAPGNVTPARHVSVASDVGFSPPVGSQNHNSGSQVGASSAQPIVPPIRNLWTPDEPGLGQVNHYRPDPPLMYHVPPPPHYTTPVPPKFAMFSGEGQKNEPSYAQWRSEVHSVWRSGIYQDALVMTNVRRSLRGRAADVLLAMGSDVSVQQLLEKLDVRFGDVRPSDMTLEQFFTARQLPAESVSAWGCRLEDLLSRVTESRSAAAARTMLRSRYWSGLYSDKIRNALRHHFDEGADFEALLRQARITEQEPSGATVQQAVTSQSQDKLDAILKQLTELTTRVQTLETKLAGMERPSTSSMHESQALPSVSNPGSSGISNTLAPTPSQQSSQFPGRCYACGQPGHKRGSPNCPKTVSGNGI